jgi:secondary thiamine-phosphate synthase enzyme
MQWFKETLEFRTIGKGLYSITAEIEKQIRSWDIQQGICYLFIQHTSASLAISESYDPSAADDLEAFMDRLAPEGQAWHRHTLEGRDDSSSHMRSLVTPVSLNIPIDHGKLSLGTWQGVYLFEHRAVPHHRKVLLRCLSVE